MWIGGDASVKAVIQSLKHGKLTKMKWVSAFGALGIAGFVLALSRDGKMGSLSSLSWFSERRISAERLCLVPGLQNLGNNCFLNVVLQALASCSYFECFLEEVVEGIEYKDDQLLLTVALAGLQQELCVLGEKRVVLSPRKVMHALSFYIQNFDLKNQQDAAEAFLHLISSLREEFSDCYIPSEGSLVDAFAVANCRFLSPKRIENRSEQERWQKHYFGPFDGILGSILTCQSCSSQISLDYQFFHSLPLLPVQDSGSSLIIGCSLEDCLKKFFIAEQVENYHCSQCWHLAAIKYLSVVGVNETEMEKLRECSAQDGCDCRRLPCLLKLPWSNNFSCTLKQLSVSRCPKILCIHLQRASINTFGELIKLQGHISFPLLLDLSPHVRSGVELKDIEESWPKGKAKVQHTRPSTSLHSITKKDDANVLKSLSGFVDEARAESLTGDEHGCTQYIDKFDILACTEYSDENLEELAGEELACTKHLDEFQEELASDEIRSTEILDKLQGKSETIQAKDCSNISCPDMCVKSDDELQVNVFPKSRWSEPYLYRLTSVVEHFGRVGSGHYTVYRSTRAEESSHNENSATCWFCISDSEVHSVSEKDVLDAEASLLFYERIAEA